MGIRSSAQWMRNSGLPGCPRWPGLFIRRVACPTLGSGEAGILSIESSGIPLGFLPVFGVPGLGTKSEVSPPRNLGI